MLKVLGFLLGLSPGVLAIVAALGGGVVMTGATYAYYNWIAIPNAVKLEVQKANDAATIRIQNAADVAKTFTETRVREEGEKTLQEYRERERARVARDAATQAQLEARISQYEQTLRDTGRACLLDERDLEFLRGQPSAGQPTGSDRRGGPNGPS